MFPPSQEVELAEAYTFPDGLPFPLFIDDDARSRHVHIIGRSGTGKSALMLRMIAGDLASGHGVGLIDPHGTLAAEALGFVPQHRFNDVIWLDPTDVAPPGLNALSRVPPAGAPLRADHILRSFEAIWNDGRSTGIGPASADLLVNALRALMDVPGSTLLGLLRLIDDAAFRTRISAGITDPVIRHYWAATVPGYSDKAWEDITRPLANKLRRVLADPRCRAVIAQKVSTFDLAEVMRRGQIMIADLGVQRLGSGISHLIGALVSATITSTAFARADGSKLRPWALYVDEFQLFATDDYATILSESRKFGLRLTVAHQFLGQLSADVRGALLNTASTIIAFRGGAEDAAELSLQLGLDELYREARLKGPEQMLALPDRTAFIRTLRAGTPETFRLATLPPGAGIHQRHQRVIANSRAQFGRPAVDTERRVEAFYADRSNASRMPAASHVVSRSIKRGGQQRINLVKRSRQSQAQARDPSSRGARSPR